jgi:hypothetical protein
MENKILLLVIYTENKSGASYAGQERHDEIKIWVLLRFTLWNNTCSAY